MKKIVKKLSLNKKTISKLNDLEMTSIQGGTNYCNPTPLTSAQCSTSNCPSTGGGGGSYTSFTCPVATNTCTVASSYAAGCNSGFHCS